MTEPTPLFPFSSASGDVASAGGVAFAGAIEQPRWMVALASALAEALPRLHACGHDPLVAEVIEALAAALGEGRLELPLSSEPHRQALAASPLAAGPLGPLVLEGDRVLWRRWQLQRDAVLDSLIARARRPLALACEQPVSDAALALLVDGHSEGLDADQRQAVAAVLRHSLVLLEGGPGTGKTSTVAQMLAAVLAQHPSCRIQLAAPTGKAAARLKAAQAATGSAWPCSTLHRLLESRGERFGRNRSHPLLLDLLVVDEVSMVDLPLMQALLEALPADCRLVLVGDSAQLPPVGPGAVLADLQAPERRAALGSAAVELRTVYRNTGAIAAVAAGLREGQRPLLELLEALPPEANLQWLQASPQRLPEALLERLLQHQQLLQQRCAALDPTDPQATAHLLEALEQCLVLTPLRRGRWGVDAIHEAVLGEVASQPPQRWPLGTPVLCRHNLPELGLANGDVGLVVEHHGERRLLFGGVAGEPPQWVHPAQLPSAQPALALTVHKAQGSEAEEVWVLVPETGRPNQRLLYTALTRARQRAHLVMAAC